MSKNKNIVICCDGTWNRFDRGAETNVSKLCYCLEHHHAQQVVYYDPGVGTIASRSMRTRVGGVWSKLLGGAFGFGVRENIAQAYKFLMTHYQEGDRIFLFGFSRGAYSVRALASVLKLFGLLERACDNLFPYIGEMILARKGVMPDFALYDRFRGTFSREVRVRFVGVWDTVSSVGWFTNPVMLPYTRKNDVVDAVRHAVAIDERRKNFRHNLFTAAPGQDLKELWFVGSHGDVGGGYPERESGLSKLALEWMIDEAVGLSEPLLVNDERTRNLLGADPCHARPDPMATLHDSSGKAFWRALQFIPRRSFRMEGDGIAGYWDWSPRRRPRALPEDAVFHPSVRIRLEQDPVYQPPNLKVASRSRMAP